MRICVLSDENIEDFDPGPFLTGLDWELHTLRAPVSERIDELAASDEYDVFLNLCEGYELEEIAEGGPGYCGLEVVEALERAGVPFTGADSQCYDPTREEQQAVAEAEGIRFVRGCQVRSVRQAVTLAGGLGYPIMVKHPQSYGSTGMYRDSRADSLAQVKAQVARVCSAYGAARMEEFVVGREYNVLVVESAEDPARPFVYPPAELIFPPGEEFWHTDVKWDYSVPFSFREVTEPGLADRLREAGRRMFLAMGMAGYARCDIRLNDAGELVMLEINPNPGIMFPLEEYGPADYMILYDGAGYPGFFDRVIRAAIVRRDLRSRPLALHGVPDSDE
jgi:D-alanine-D-alanine ligase